MDKHRCRRLPGESENMPYPDQAQGGTFLPQTLTGVRELTAADHTLKLPGRFQPINPFGEQPLESLAIALYYLRHCEKPPPNSRIFQ
jgi:hypothetical protein